MRRFYEARLADEAWNIVKRMRNQNILERLALRTQNGTLGKEDPHTDKLVGAMEDMGIRIGDDTHQHFHEAPKPTTAIPWWMKAAGGAALVASGAGVGAGVPMILDALKDKATEPPAVVQPNTTPDTNTEYRLDLVP